MEAGKSKILFSDLDGTLIFSAKRRRVGDIIADSLRGEPVSCITPRQADLLPDIRCIIPVTTRSLEQYRRIRFPAGFSPEYALCSNGRTLLVNCVPDPDWTSCSTAVYRKCEGELERFRGLLENDPDRCFEIRTVDGLFLFTKSGDTAHTLKRLGTGELCECFAHGRKVFVIPKKLSKGLAVRELAERLELTRENIVCAGDSLVDVPMLNEAGTALFTDNIAPELVTADIKHRRPQDGFTEFVTEFALNLNTKR